MMMKKKWMFAAATLLAGGLLTWIWLGRGPAETAGIHFVDAGGEVAPAEGGGVEGPHMGSTPATGRGVQTFYELEGDPQKGGGNTKKFYGDGQAPNGGPA